ncbi:unnamed protein product [Rotaria sordida]|uniref:Uncharacterized protein n=1 Tax=Rotaria sordida TaxID=392033 RepID=A0A815UQV2_9BILA|nr:unnamed protein product [Rotaria sordida]CAF1523200.1 unnamed protein product [Rotaria sordida]
MQEMTIASRIILNSQYLDVKLKCFYTSSLTDFLDCNQQIYYKEIIGVCVDSKEQKIKTSNNLIKNNSTIFIYLIQMINSLLENTSLHSSLTIFNYYAMYCTNMFMYITFNTCYLL